MSGEKFNSMDVAGSSSDQRSTCFGLNAGAPKSSRKEIAWKSPSRPTALYIYLCS